MHSYFSFSAMTTKKYMQNKEFVLEKDFYESTGGDSSPARRVLPERPPRGAAHLATTASRCLRQVVIAPQQHFLNTHKI